MPTLGVRAANPIWWLPDLVGQPLNDQYYISFLTNTFPYLPQPIFEDVNLTIPWANPLIFFPNGTLPDNMYWDPNLVWRLEIRRGPTQSDALIYEINNFVPCCTGANPNPPEPEGIFTQENQITNPQFSEINFTSPLTLTSAGTYSIAPGWDLILSGSGTITITQLIFSGNQGITDNPPFGLKFDSSGWSSVILSQTFNNNGAIWNGGAIAGSLLGRAEVTPEVVTMNYVPSDSGTPVQIFQATLPTGNFIFEGGKEDVIPVPSTNTDLSTVANVQIQIVLPATGIVDLSNIQITGQSTPLDPSSIALPAFQQETQERELDHKFHYFAQQLIEQPKNNILTGSIFALNPWQFITRALTLVAVQTQYVADQTILHQETAGAIKSGQWTNNQAYALQLAAVNGVNANRFAVIQYIDSATIAPYWGNILSSMVCARISTAHSTQLNLKARLIYRASLPPTLSNTEPITGWDVNGDLTFAAGWTAITPLNDPSYLLSNGYDTTNGVQGCPRLAYNQFSLPADPNTNLPNNSTVGLVIYTTDNMDNTLGSEDTFLLESWSLVPNKFAVEASPETFDQSLKKCQFYYEKSYNIGVLPATITTSGEKFQPTQIVKDTPDSVSFNTFSVNYMSEKRAIVVPTFYSPTSATASRVRIGIRNALSNSFVDSAISNWLADGGSQHGVVMLGNNNANATTLTTDTANEGCIFFHYVADARLGL